MSADTRESLQEELRSEIEIWNSHGHPTRRLHALRRIREIRELLKHYDTVGARHVERMNRTEDGE